MKKIFSLFILILTLCLGSTVFGAKAWSEIEFEKLINLVGYGEIDLDEFDFPSTTTKTTFINLLNNNDKGLIILRGNNDNLDGFDSSRFCVYIENSSCDIVFSSYKNVYSLYSNYNSSVFSSPYIFDINTKSVSKSSITAAANNGSLFYPYTWQKSNCTVSEEEWISTGYKTLLFQDACIFSDFSIGNTYYYPAGGRITSSNLSDDIICNGSIFYYPTTKLAEFTLGDGFESGVNYELFMEEYKLDNETGYGINYNTLVTTKIGSVSKDISSYDLSDFTFNKEANYVYRLCVGSISGDNEVYIASDWLVPNDNTFRMYPYFTMSHYYTFLSLVGLDYDYILPDEDIGDSGEDGGETGSDIEDYLPYFISVPAYPQSNECLVYFYIGDYGLNNLSFLIEKLDDSGGILSSNTLSSSIVNNVSYGMAKVDFCKYFSFEDNSFYRITLVGKDGVKLDASSVIYFLGSNTGNYEGDKPYIINSPVGYVRSSGDIIVTVYMPSDYEYEDSVYLSVQKYDLSGDYINSTVIADSNMWLQLDSESGICPIYLSSFCDFDTSGNYYYRINLNEFNKGTLDTTDIFYFDIDTGENINKDNLPINPNNPSFNFDTTDMESLINSTTTWTDSIFGFLTIFPDWLNACIMAGIAVVVICRILGR